MPQVDFKTEEELTDDYLTYLLNKAIAISRTNEFEIENFADLEAANPDVDRIPIEDDLDTLAEGADALALGFAEESQVAKPRKAKFKKLKRKVKRIFCNITEKLQADGDIKPKDILKAVLLAVIPAFGAVHAIVSTIVLSLMAMFLKKGYNKVCGLV